MRRPNALLSRAFVQTKLAIICNNGKILLPVHREGAKYICAAAETMATDFVPWVFRLGGYFLLTTGSVYILAPLFYWCVLLLMSALHISHCLKVIRSHVHLSNLIPNDVRASINRVVGMRMWHQVAWRVRVNVLKHGVGGGTMLHFCGRRSGALFSLII